ncbi:unnamed protein product [Schistosoma turkestanicum]|nr:unnamed protein product [Schistosoma turkestanicum]
MNESLTRSKKSVGSDKAAHNRRQRYTSVSPEKSSTNLQVHKPDEVWARNHSNRVCGSKEDDRKKRIKSNSSQRPSTQKINKSKRSKSIPSTSTKSAEFLSNEEDRELFAKQRSIIYQLNEIMKKSEIANYEAFMNLNHTNQSCK